MSEISMEHLTVPASLDSLPAIGQFVLRAASSAGLDRQASYGLRLAVHEIAANCLIHGQAGADSQAVLEVHAAIHEQGVTITLEDTGVPYDPRQAPPPEDLSRPLEERATGGMGVFLAQRSVDLLDYERSGAKNRCIFFMKRRPAPLP
jgi:anti-sigma regulatory factor (Ser/Thr protein kinase)